MLTMDGADVYHLQIPNHWMKESDTTKLIINVKDVCILISINSAIGSLTTRMF